MMDSKAKIAKIDVGIEGCTRTPFSEESWHWSVLEPAPVQHLNAGGGGHRVGRAWLSADHRVKHGLDVCEAPAFAAQWLVWSILWFRWFGCLSAALGATCGILVRFYWSSRGLGVVSCRLEVVLSWNFLIFLGFLGYSFILIS